MSEKFTAQYSGYNEGEFIRYFHTEDTDVSVKIFIVVVQHYYNTKKVLLVACFLLLSLNNRKRGTIFLVLFVLNDLIYLFNNTQSIFYIKNQGGLGFNYVVKWSIRAN